jgi:DNA-cytosine methyltransferase
MNVLSLFDGMSCARLALDRAGIEVNNYYASEIDKFAIQVSNDNFPGIVQIGNILNLDDHYLKSLKIDILIGGSPCQGFSMLGKNKGSSTLCGIDVTTLQQYQDLKDEGFEFDGQSFLFWEYVRIKRLINPKYWLLENVRLSKKWENMFNHAIGSNPTFINSSLFSAQNRPRYYWSNIDFNKNIEDKKILLGDVIESAPTDPKFCSEKAIDMMYGKFGTKSRFLTIKNPFKGKSGCLLASMYKGVPKGVIIIDIELQNKIYNGEIIDAKKLMGKVRLFSVNECEALQTVPKGYCDCVSRSQSLKMLGNGFTIDVISHILQGIHNPPLKIQKSLF